MKLILFILLTLFQTCKYENSNYNRTMLESEEERVIGIQGVISKIEILKKEFQNANNAKLTHYYSLKLNLDTTAKLIAFEDSSKKRIAEIPELNSIYEKEKLTFLSFEKDFPLEDKLKQFTVYKVSDRVIVRIPYWSISKFLRKESELIQMYSIEKLD
jgi:hypothetical protein